MTQNNSINAVYEEAQSFTPTIEGTTDAEEGTYDLQFGLWSRIGNVIFFSLDIVWTAHTGSGDILVANMPYNCNGTTNYNPECECNTENITLPASTVTVFGHILRGDNKIQAETIQTSGNNVPISLAASGSIHMTGTYLRA